MLRKVRQRLSYANLMSTMAVFIALGGTSYAAVQLSKNSVRSKHIKNGQVKAADLRADAVTSPKVKNGSLLAEDFQPGQLVAGSPGPAGPQGPKGDTGAQGPVGPAGPSTGAAGGDLTGNYPNPTLAANSVEAAEIVNGSLDAADIASTTGSFDLDMTSIAAQDCATFFPEPPGVLTTDVIVVTPSSDFAGFDLALTAVRAFSNNFIRLRVCNPTAAAIDPPSMNFRFVAFNT